MKRQWFLDSFGAPVADIRAKLIEEAWFGRRVNEPIQSNDLGWMREERSPRSDSAEHAPDRSPDHSRDQNHGIDLDR